MTLSIQELETFLTEANKHTYADKSAEKTTPSRLASEDYHFEKGNLIYHDTYFGGRDFIGGEIVYKEQKAKWGMNYHGFVMKPEISEKEVYDFLRQALLQEYTDIIPVRGPTHYVVGDWKYTNSLEGDLKRFIGTEEISLHGEIVYRCWYHGGFIG